MNLMILTGPNLNLLGRREPALYGTATYDDLLRRIEQTALELDLEACVYQSNHEGDLVDQVQAAYGVYDGIVLNPAAYTHTSVALLDALLAVSIPTVEVHLTDLSKREAFRQISYIRPACVATFTGLGIEGYRKAMQFLRDYLRRNLGAK